MKRSASGEDKGDYLRVAEIVDETQRVRSYRMVRDDGSLLTEYLPGAHVTVRAPDGSLRQYSLMGRPADRSCYRIAVLRELMGRGGSAAMHDRLALGDRLWVSGPRNHFPLGSHPSEVLLIAGGIGITPLLPMAEALAARRTPFWLHYCTRSPEETPFRDELIARAGPERVVFHHDHGNPARGIDLKSVLKSAPAGTHLYYCGPPGLMKAIATAAAGWDSAHLHCEHFSPETDRSVAPGSFEITLARSGGRYVVPKDRSIVEVLRTHAIPINTMCENGVCGECRTRYLAGSPEHHDVILSDEERREYVMVCCARAGADGLVLDL